MRSQICHDGRDLAEMTAAEAVTLAPDCNISAFGVLPFKCPDPFESHQAGEVIERVELSVHALLEPLEWISP